ncbi:hypothetical protein M885DRAFT_571967 [Pelagophyceae sp. CCMP2097]|nr:hypothetical protein M885DRAFT_571967 [Pelagophyceae sp. CCMP2097]
METTKLPSSRLCLTYEFVLSAVLKEPSSAVHDAAVKSAAAQCGLCAPASISARATRLDGCTLANVAGGGFDASFHVADGGPAVRLEFYYDGLAPRLCVRIVTILGEGPASMIDGVTASRLAFHAMEVLEEVEMKRDSPAAREGRVPPFHYGARHRFNFLREVGGALLRTAVANASLFFDRVLQRAPPKDLTLVHDATTLFRFYASPNRNEPCQFRCYRPDHEREV